MNAKITRLDVFKYLADRLEGNRRLEVEEAYRTDPRVREWFDDYLDDDEDDHLEEEEDGDELELEPAESSAIGSMGEESDVEPIESPVLFDPANAALAAMAYDIVSERRYREFVENPAEELLFDLKPDSTTVVGDVMIHRHTVPKGLAARPNAPESTDNTPVDPPYIRLTPDALEVCQARDRLSDGRIDIEVVRLKKVEGSDRSILERVRTSWDKPLKCENDWWYAAIPYEEFMPPGWAPSEVQTYVVSPSTTRPFEREEGK